MATNDTETKDWDEEMEREEETKGKKITAGRNTKKLLEEDNKDLQRKLSSETAFRKKMENERNDKQMEILILTATETEDKQQIYTLRTKVTKLQTERDEKHAEIDKLSTAETVFKGTIIKLEADKKVIKRKRITDKQ